MTFAVFAGSVPISGSTSPARRVAHTTNKTEGTMTDARVRLWRSQLAQRIYQAISDPTEQVLFVRLLTTHAISETALKVIEERWMADRHVGESIIAYLFNVDWLVLGTVKASSSYSFPGEPLLTRTAVEMIQRGSSIRDSSWKKRMKRIADFLWYLLALDRPCPRPSSRTLAACVRDRSRAADL